MDRRKFLGSLAVAGLGTVGLAACARAGSAPLNNGRRLDRIGVQLYTVRTRMQQGVPQTLRAVADMGYREVETAGLFDLTPQQFRAELDRVGLVSPAGHYPINALRDNTAGTLTTAAALGQRWLVVPWLDPAERTAAGYRRLAADLNSAGTAARDRGLRVGYHNHEFEFDRVDGQRTGMDILLAETDPALVDIELDLFWAVKAGHDPLTLFAAHPGRFRLCHVKDMADIGGAERMVDVGQGQIDFARIFARSEQAGLQHYFVEHDNPSDPMATLRNSIEHVRQLEF
jgi:sugar phosphate isomerase/epimerase